MPFPALYAYMVLSDIPTSCRSQEYAWACFFAMVAQLPFSIACHGMCVMSDNGKDAKDTPWRILDQTLVHVGCTVGTLGLSQSPMYALGVAFPFNMYAVILLWSLAASEEDDRRMA